MVRGASKPLGLGGDLLSELGKEGILQLVAPVCR